VDALTQAHRSAAPGGRLQIALAAMPVEAREPQAPGSYSYRDFASRVLSQTAPAAGSRASGPWGMGWRSLPSSQAQPLGQVQARLKVGQCPGDRKPGGHCTLITSDSFTLV
jgi:hypothetical protein